MLKQVNSLAELTEGMKLTVRQWDTLVKEYGVTNDGNLKTPGTHHILKLQVLSGREVTINNIIGKRIIIQEDESSIYPWYLFEECYVKPKFKVGQRVRFKSHEELKQIGRRINIQVDIDFKYTNKILVILGINNLTPGYNVNWYHWNYHEDFFQPVYELDARFKEV